MRVAIHLTDGTVHIWATEGAQRRSDDKVFATMKTPTQANQSLRFDGVEKGKAFSRTYPLTSVLWWTVWKEDA